MAVDPEVPLRRLRHRRRRLQRRLLLLLLHHLVGHREAHAQLHAVTGHPATPHVAHAVGELELLKGAEVRRGTKGAAAKRAHRAALVDRLLHALGHVDVDDLQAGDRQAVLVVDLRGDPGANQLAKLRVRRQQIKCCDLCFADHVGQRLLDQRAHHLPELFGVVDAVGADELLEQQLRIGAADRVGAKGADADRAEVGVAHHQRLRRAPLQASDGLCRHEVDFAFEGRVEAMLPAFQRRHDRHVRRRQLVHAFGEDIRDAALVDKDRRLARPHRQLRAVFDLVLVARKAPHHGLAVGVIEPLDDVDELALQFVEETHGVDLRPFGSAA